MYSCANRHACLHKVFDHHHNLQSLASFMIFLPEVELQLVLDNFLHSEMHVKIIFCKILYEKSLQLYAVLLQSLQ